MSGLDLWMELEYMARGSDAWKGVWTQGEKFGPVVELGPVCVRVLLLVSY